MALAGVVISDQCMASAGVVVSHQCTATAGATTQQSRIDSTLQI
jgi:hypothetical protein